MTSTPAYHHAQIVRTLPAWSKQLHPSHTRKMIQSLRNDYIDEHGVPYPWFAGARPDWQDGVRRAIAKRNESRKALQQALAPLKGISEFCAPLLEQRLALDIPVDQAQYSFQPFEDIGDSWVSPIDVEYPVATERETNVSATRPKGSPQLRSLLEAALHNFTGISQAGPYSTLQYSATDTRTLPTLTVERFIQHCRTLDLGAHYQAHLDAIHGGVAGETLEALMSEANRDELRVRARIASLQGLLSAHGLDALHQLSNNLPTPRYNQSALHCWRLSLFDIGLHEVLLIGPDQPDQINPLILYIPGDDQEPLREYPSLREAMARFKAQLLRTTFRRQINALAPGPLQPALAKKLQHALFERRELNGSEVLHPRNAPKIVLSITRLPIQPWTTLHKLHVLRLKGDAACIAVPTAAVDAQAQLERLKHWYEVGLNVLNVAAMFVPGLNTVMLAVGASQILQSVFHGLHAWEAGETAEALAQLESIMVNLAVVGTLAGGAAVIKASGFVDIMKRVWIEGEERLWSANLTGYRSRVELPASLEPNEQGQYLLDGKYYIRLDGELYEQVKAADNSWRLKHPEDAHAYSPQLNHNQQGAWRVEHEQPMDWDTTRLLRRLGPPSADLSDQQLLSAMRSTGLDEDVLRYTHMRAKPAPALLVDALTRLRLDHEVDDIIVRVGDGRSLAAYKNYAVPALLELPNWPQDHAIRVFNGPELWGSSTLYGQGSVEIQLNRTNLEQGELATAVLSQMDEQTASALLPNTSQELRAQNLQKKLADHLSGQHTAMFQSLYLGHRPALSEAAQTLGRQFTSLPDPALEEIVEHATPLERKQLAGRRVPLRIGEEARRLQSRVRLDRALIGLHRPTLANADTRLLEEALLVERPDLANATPAQLFALLANDRPLAARLLGQQAIRPGFRSPLRLSDGRVGYPLSGRQGTSARRLRDLYPALDSRQRQTMLQRLTQRGDLATQLNVLEEEWRNLDSSLSAWSQAVGDVRRASREVFSDAVRSAWRGETGATLEVTSIELETLPPLPARMEHITAITVRDAGVRHMAEAFLQSFPNLERLRVIQNPELDSTTLFQALRRSTRLRELDLRNNQMATLPANALPTLTQLRQLRSLSLRHNDLRLSAEQLRALTQLPVELLDLNRNAIELDASTAPYFQDMVHLRRLELAGNPLRIAPDVRYLARLEHLNLSRTQLTSWPEGLTTLMSQRNYQLRHLDLSDNAIPLVPDLETVLATPYAQGLRDERAGLRWHFNYNRLQEGQALRLRESSISVIEHSVSESESEGGWLEAGSAQQRARAEAFMISLENEPVVDVLDRLTLSAEALHHPQGLYRRVWALLGRVTEDDQLRQRIVEVAREYPATCGDAGTDAFSALELEVLAFDETEYADLAPQYSFNFYRRLFRRAQVNAIADNIAVRRALRRAALVDNLPELPELAPEDAISDEDLRNSLVDDIEIRLALRQALAPEALLDFPEPSQGMLYRQTAMITSTIEYNVEQRVYELDSVPANRHEWMVRHPTWQLFLQREYGDQLSALTEAWLHGSNYLSGVYELTDGPLTPEVTQALTAAVGHSPIEDGQLRQAELEGQALIDAWASFKQAKERAEHALQLRLTAALDRNNRGPNS